jgi:hypothetical protein
MNDASFWSSVHFWTARELHHRLTDAGLRIDATHGAIYFPPLVGVAQLMARMDRALARLGTFGAAFVCVAARKG